MNNKENFIEQYQKSTKFNTNNNQRSFETLKSCEVKLATFLDVSDLFSFLLEISNNDEFNFIYKFTYDYFFKNESLKLEIEDELVYIEHKTEREETSSSLRQEIINESNGQCYFNCTNESFLNNNKQAYLEVHHCIPLSVAKKLEIKGDFKENLIAVCPTCHRRIHYEDNESSTKQEMMEKIYVKVEEQCKIYGLNSYIDLMT